FSRTFSASDLTWRLELPVAITMQSVTPALPRTSMAVMSLPLSSSRASIARAAMSRLAIFSFCMCQLSASCSGCRAVESARLDVVEHRVRPQIAYRAAAGQQLADAGGGHRERGLPDEGNLPGRVGHRLRIGRTARRLQVAQCLGRLAVGIR